MAQSRMYRVANEYSAKLHRMSTQAAVAADRLCQDKLPEDSDELFHLAAQVELAAHSLLDSARQAIELAGEMRGFAEATRVYDPSCGGK